MTKDEKKLNNKKIRELREKTGLSQSRFALEYHIPLNSIQKWEQGVAKAPVYILYLLERVVEDDCSKGRWG